MTTLQFADTHNLVVFLAKPAESEGFEQIVDFLNAHTIKYALMVNPTIYTSCIEQFWATVKAKTINEEVQLQALVDGKKIIVTEASIRSDLLLNDEEAKMGEGSTIPTYPHNTPTIIQPSTSQPQKKQRSRRPKRKDTEVPQPSGPTTNVTDKAVYEERDDSLEKAATTATGLDAEQDRGGCIQTWEEIDDIDKDADITLVDETQGRYGDDIMFDVSDLAGEEVFVAEQGVSNKDVNFNVDEVTLAQALAALKSAKVQEKANVVEEPSELITPTPTLTTKTAATTIIATSTRPKSKRLVIHEQEQAPTPTVSLQQPSHAKIQDTSKAKMLEHEPVNKLSKKDQLKLDEEAKIEADCLFAERLQEREQEELTIEERAKLCQQLLEKRFAAKRAEEKRNRPPTKAQYRSIMCTYLKNMEGWKPKDLKSKSFANIQELFNKAMKRVNTFVDYRTELVEGSSKKSGAEIAQESSSKRVGDELEQESIKKQKVDEDKETTEIQSMMEVIPDEEEVAVDAIPLATKPPSIVDWKIHKEGKKSYYQIIKADGSSKMYLMFCHMLKSFDKEDLKTLYKLVKAKYG
ncbi:hypothetical protein Tco_0143970 [Tanacetum coccineum]